MGMRMTVGMVRMRVRMGLGMARMRVRMGDKGENGDVDEDVTTRMRIRILYENCVEDGDDDANSCIGVAPSKNPM